MRANLLLTLLLLLPAALLAGDGRIRKSANPVQNEYIVVLADGVDKRDVGSLAAELTKGQGTKLQAAWSDALKGFAAKMTEERAKALAHDPRVRYVEENSYMYLSTTTTQQTNVDPAANTTETDNRLWHLDAIDQDSAIASHEFRHCGGDGTGATIYVVDTGVVGQHSEFLRADGTSRVEVGHNTSGDGLPANDPCNGFVTPALHRDEEGNAFTEHVGGGHGTSVASVAAGKKVGIAKNARIVPVKVSPCRMLDLRRRHASTHYDAGYKVWMKIDGNRYFEALTSGDTSDEFLPDGFRNTAEHCPLKSPHVHDPDGIGCHVVDGEVTWLRLSNTHFANIPTAQTTIMLIDGLNWIIGPLNPYPKANAVVTMSTYRVITHDDVVGSGNTLDTVARAVSLEIPFVASANNQNSNANLTSPAKMSRPAGKVITVGGLMVVNNPDRIDAAEVPLDDQASGTPLSPLSNQTEPPYQPTVPTRYARWICGPGDSTPCSDGPPPSTAIAGNFANYTGGSNGGPSVSLFAPARNVNVAATRSATDYRDPRRFNERASGTSWSAPIVAGVIATMLPGMTGENVDTVFNALMDKVVVNEIVDETNYPLNPTGLSDTPNKMLRLGDVRITAHPAWSPGATQLSVTATSNEPLTYQWYQVNAGFDLTKTRGAASSTPIAGATSATLAISPSATATGYWVRVTGCGVADSNIAVVQATVAVPTAVNAIKTGATTVAVSWSGSQSATKYELQRKAPNGDWISVDDDISGMSHTDTNAPASSMLLYRVRAGAGSAWSEFSKADFANTNTPANTTSTVKRSDILEQRTAVNQLCGLLNIANKFTAEELQSTSLTGIQAGNFSGLMTKINEVRANPQLSLSPFPWGTPPASGQRLFLTQRQDLRDALQ